MALLLDVMVLDCDLIIPFVLKCYKRCSAIIVERGRKWKGRRSVTYHKQDRCYE